MTTKFYPSGTTVRVSTFNESEGTDKLAPRVYGVGKSMFGFYLTIKEDSLELPPKIYGKTLARADKVINTFNARSGSTGILLTGTKGSGKTMLSSLICNKLIEQGLPVILISEPWHGDDFVEFINELGECVILFDEFAKTYARAEGQAQSSLLTMMDGTEASKRLIILTENDEREINEYMINRPGRIYYHFRYNKLDEDTIKGFCEDKGIDKETIDKIVDMSRTMRTFTFDILKAIVEEYLRIGGEVEDLMEDMNITYDKNVKIRLKLTKAIRKQDDKEFKFKLFDSYTDKPTNGGWSNVNLIDPDVDKKHPNYDEGDEIISLSFNSRHLQFEMDGKYVYDNGSYIFTLEEQESFAINYGSYVN